MPVQAQASVRARNLRELRSLGVLDDRDLVREHVSIGAR